MTALPAPQLPLDAVELARTDTRTHAVHLIECPHLVGRTWHRATPGERTEFPLCTWSRDQLSGHGRSHPASIADAMREQGTPASVAAYLIRLLAGVEHDEIWLPYSGSYVALGLGGRAVASFGKTYAWVQGHRVELPGYTPAGRERRTPAPAVGETCSTHFVERSLTGSCDRCEP